jgi:hypothetical protein
LEVSGGFRYLADLEPSTDAQLPLPAAVWSSDSQKLLFVAPRQQPTGTGGSWLQPESARALYVARSAEAPPTELVDTDLEDAVWREDGEVLGLTRRTSDGSLSLTVVDPAGASDARSVLDLPLRVSTTFGVAWDAARADFLIATPTPAGGTDYWLALLGLEGDS